MLCAFKNSPALVDEHGSRPEKAGIFRAKLKRKSWQCEQRERRADDQTSGQHLEFYRLLLPVSTRSVFTVRCATDQRNPKTETLNHSSGFPTGDLSEKCVSLSSVANMEEANKLIGSGKKHLVMGKVVEAVSALQEACGMLWV